MASGSGAGRQHALKSPHLEPPARHGDRSEEWTTPSQSQDARHPANVEGKSTGPAVAGVFRMSGPSRAGKSTIAALMQDTVDGIWMHLGMDLHIQATPPRYKPGVGLRPVRLEDVRDVDGRVSYADLVDAVPALYASLYGAAAAHVRNGLNVVMDVYHHDNYPKPLDTLGIAKRELAGLRTLFVGVNAPLDTIWERRAQTWGQYRDSVDDDVRRAVEMHDAAARALTYDIEVDTGELSPDECVARIARRLADGPGSIL